jgi:hypothetical protein
MTRLACTRAGLLLDQRTAGLSGADALRLEDHLAGCESCAADASMLDAMRGLAHGSDGTLPKAARERALAGAFAQARAERGTPALLTFPRVLAMSAAVAAGVALGLSLRTLRPDAAAPVVAAKPAPRSVTVALAARPEVAPSAGEGVKPAASSDEAIGAITEQPDDGVLRAPEGATVALAHAELELSPGTEARWDRKHRVLQLERGSVLADVDPGPHQRFTVRTASFDVIVLGTRFEVTLDGVRVERGLVRVVAPNGHVLAQALGAGERFELGQRARGRHSPRRQLGETSRAAEAASMADARQLLERARTALAEKHVAQARELIASALRLDPAEAERAEALSLRAEGALVEGRLDAAISGYLQVADAYAQLGAGENALFAAARLEKNRGRGGDAAQLFERYLARYPRGRFAKEATSRLRELRATTNPDP